MSKKRVIPETVPLYWKCELCGKLVEWPKHGAAMYCSNACKQKAYRLRIKEREGYTVLRGDEFDELFDSLGENPAEPSPEDAPGNKEDHNQ